MSLRHIIPGLAKLGIATALLLSVTTTAGWAQSRPTVKDLGGTPPASVIYIGNSFFYYNNSMHGHIALMLREGMRDFKHRASSVTISGSGLDWHDVGSYFRPAGIGKYSFVGDNEVVFNPPTDKLFEVAVMMDCSQCPVHPTLSKSFTEYTKKHSDTVRKNGGKPVFFMSWAYQDKPEMTQQLAEAYTVAANANNALVIPAGLAFANSIKLKPDLNLYVADKRHPSLAGTYLAAATTYATLFGKSPVGLKYDAGLGADTAAHLQKVAQDTVQQYLAR
ncbi:DUF4886 domain-containing protein [Ferrovibrio terrae]|jgi:hypothetical protein|uniref:DUF4886 domain-containing protein n=1 Tax=Ferrovibrio terrae TaxID=2594003 RepID=UPI003137E5E9